MYFWSNVNTNKAATLWRWLAAVGVVGLTVPEPGSSWWGMRGVWEPSAFCAHTATSVGVCPTTEGTGRTTGNTLSAAAARLSSSRQLSGSDSRRGIYVKIGYLAMRWSLWRADLKPSGVQGEGGRGGVQVDLRYGVNRVFGEGGGDRGGDRVSDWVWR